MKKIIAITLTLILASAMVLPTLQQAEAIKSDTTNRLSPKSYGEKTINLQCGDISCFIKTFSQSKNPAKDAKFKWFEDKQAELLIKYLIPIGYLPP